MKTGLAAALFLAVPFLTGQEIQLEQVAGGLTAPTDIQSAGDGSGRLFFVQQNGIIRLFKNGALVQQPFLDISGKTQASGERGLLGLAFPPGFAQKKRFFVNYTDLDGNTVIAQYGLTSDPDAADPASEAVLLRVTQPFANHNGGQLRFGPDGYLYIGLGDGGSGGDPLGNAQNLGTPLGKLLRVDVDRQPGEMRTPPDNPFVNTPHALTTIWAYGLRNPWRFSFDRANGDLYIGDVGQGLYEEVDYQPAGSPGGRNYGWNVMEGLHCYAAATCDMQGLTLPVTEYPHGAECSMTGGFVYRGAVSPGLRGTYLYGDFCSGKIWGLTREGSNWVSRDLLSSGLRITTFGEDEAGELYVAGSSGSIYHIVGAQVPRLTAAGVVNAADFQPGLTPGSAATAFAAGVKDDEGVTAASGIPVATSLGDVSVSVNGVAAPLFAVANFKGQEQVNFQVPYSIAGQQTATVIVSRGGKASAAVSVPVYDLQPALFGNGGQGVVVHNSDYTLVTSANPLRPGEYAFTYATGLGSVDNAPQDGAGAPLSPLAHATADVRATLAGLPCDVQFAGLAPQLVGVYQVNFRVPEGGPGGMQDLVVSAGGAASRPQKVAVQ